jgi:hypothetical protein
MDAFGNKQQQEKRQQKGRDFEDIFAELKASEGGKHYSPSARTKLFNEFIRHAKADPLEVRTLLERPPEYDVVSPAGEVIKSYLGLPVLLVLQPGTPMQRGVAMEHIMALGGWKSATMAKRYARVNPVELHEQIRLLQETEDESPTHSP